MVRLYALLAVAVLVALIIVYTHEFDWLSNTINVRSLVIGSFLFGLLFSAGVIWYFRDRFTPLQRHFPEIAVITLLITIFSPLAGSLLNRLARTTQYEQFIFSSEQAYVARGYGILKTESLRPTGWILSVERNGHYYQFKYKDQPYFPITKPGEIIELPVKHGLFGFEVISL
jgi:hypothetical protein